MLEVKIKKIVIFIVCIVSVNFISVYGKHSIGAAVEYEVKANPDGTFTVNGSFNEYRNSISNGAQLDKSKLIGVYVKFGLDWIFYDTIVSQRSEIFQMRNIKPKFLCESKSVYEAEYAEYHFSITIPYQQSEIMFAIQRCCRENNITNYLNDQGIALYFVISPKGQKTSHSSPRIIRNFKNVIFVNILDTLHFFDWNDSNKIIKYNWSKARTAGSIDSDAKDCLSPVPDPVFYLPPFEFLRYHPSFSYDKPFYKESIQNLNTSTGQVEVMSSLSGNFGISFSAEIYEDQTLLSSFLFDFQIVIIPNSPNKKFYGGRFYDKNENKIKDSDEPFFNFPTRVFDNHCNNYFDPNGNYFLNMYEDAKVNYISNDTNWIINSSSKNQLFTGELDDKNPIHIPFKIVKSGVKNIKSNIYFKEQNCDMPSQVVIEISNNGTVDFSGIALLIIDSDISINEVPEIFLQKGDTLLISDLNLPIATQSTYILDVSLPHRFSATDELHIFTTIRDEIIDSSLFQRDFAFKFDCSSTGNDKTVVPSRSYFNLVSPEEDLYYTIRFKNTGKTILKNIEIRDTLSSNLDQSSVEVLSSSHHYTMKNDNGKLFFYFENINLPIDSQDLEKNKGHVIFKVRPSRWISEGEVISNKAFIYHDDKNVIPTNITKNLVSYFESSFENNDINQPKIQIIPNPVQNNEIILLPEEWILPVDVEIQIINAVGQIIFYDKIILGKPIDVTNLYKGLYFVLIRNNGKILTTKSFFKN